MTEDASISSRSSGKPKSCGFSSFKSLSKFTATFPHVRINEKADINPAVVLDEGAFEYFMLRFLPLKTKFDSCVKERGNEKALCFLIYELLSTVATYGKINEKEGVRLAFNDQTLEEYSDFLHHDFSFANTGETNYGPVKFVVSFQQNVNNYREAIVS